MKILITRQTFIKGRLVQPGDIVEVQSSDYTSNLINKAVPIPTAPEIKKANVTAAAMKKARAGAKKEAKAKAKTAAKTRKKEA